MYLRLERTVVVGAWVGVVALRPRTDRLAAIAARPSQSLSTEGADRVIGDLATGALWLICAWLAATSLSMAAGRLPGAAGALADAAARRIAPHAMRRLVAAAIGAGVLAGPAIAAADPAPAPDVTVTWPLSTDPAPPPAWPVDEPEPLGTPAPEPSPPSPPSPNEATGSVLVRPGDTLWSIASAALGPDAPAADIAAAWPQWYRANAAAIGADPNLIQPGITLTAPAQGDLL